MLRISRRLRRLLKSSLTRQKSVRRREDIKEVKFFYDLPRMKKKLFYKNNFGYVAFSEKNQKIQQVKSLQALNLNW